MGGMHLGGLLMAWAGGNESLEQAGQGGDGEEWREAPESLCQVLRCGNVGERGERGGCLLSVGGVAI